MGGRGVRGLEGCGCAGEWQAHKVAGDSGVQGLEGHAKGWRGCSGAGAEGVQEMAGRRDVGNRGHGVQGMERVLGCRGWRGSGGWSCAELGGRAGDACVEGMQRYVDAAPLTSRPTKLFFFSSLSGGKKKRKPKQNRPTTNNETQNTHPRTFHLPWFMRFLLYLGEGATPHLRDPPPFPGAPALPPRRPRAVPGD